MTLRRLLRGLGRRLARVASGGPAASTARVPLVLYTRPACPLCDEMKQELRAARLSRSFTLSEVDIDADPRLQARFARSIPVLEIAGRVAFKGRLDARSLERRFDRIVREREQAPRGRRTR